MEAHSWKIRTRGLYAEFGVFSGYSINHFAEIHKDRTLYGFDSFVGLREDWGGTDMGEGSFDRKGKLPAVRINVSLIKGWFSETLPVFLEEHSEDFAFIHFDADTYESTHYVLNTLEKRIVPGTIIIFDEYLGFPNWESGEFLAWQQFVEKKTFPISI